MYKKKKREYIFYCNLSKNEKKNFPAIAISYTFNL